MRCVSLMCCLLISIVSGCSTTKSEDFLTATEYKRLEIRVNYVKECEPQKDALLELTNFIKKHCHKPQGIELRINEMHLDLKPVWSIEDLEKIINDHKVAYLDEHTLTMYIFYITGKEINEPKGNKFTGIAFEDSFFIFKQRLKSEDEKRALCHEMGHLLSLEHCMNKCLMYYHANGQIEDLDEECHNKLINLGGK